MEPVIQADRDRAADYYLITDGHRTGQHIANLVRQGNHAHVLVQAFAAHRIAGQAELVDLLRMARGYVSAIANADDHTVGDLLLLAKIDAALQPLSQAGEGSK